MKAKTRKYFRNLKNALLGFTEETIDQVHKKNLEFLHTKCWALEENVDKEYKLHFNKGCKSHADKKRNAEYAKMVTYEILGR